MKKNSHRGQAASMRGAVCVCLVESDILFGAWVGGWVGGLGIQSLDGGGGGMMILLI